MAEMDKTVCTLRDRIPDSYEKPMQWPSNSNFPFTVQQVKNAFNDIYKYMLPKDQLSIVLPPKDSIKDEELLKNLNKRFLELGNATKHGLVHATKSLTVLLNLDPIEVPDCIKLEVFIILPDRSCRILCVTDDIHNQSHKTYLLRLTRNVTCRLRKFTSEHVTVLYGLVDENEMSSNDTFSQKMKDIQKDISQFCIPDSLVMNKGKCDNIIRAFLASIAATDLLSVKNDDKDCDEETLWLFTPQQFQVFVENIDRELVVLESVPKSGATLLVQEVKQRLNKIVPSSKHKRGISSWNSISEHSLENISTLPDWPCVYYAARVLVCVASFMMVLVSMTVSNICLLSLTSDLHVSEDTDLVFRNAKRESLPFSPSPKNSKIQEVTEASDTHLSTDVMTVWQLLILLCVPYLCTTLACVWKIITMQTEKLQWKMVFKEAVPETIHTIGLNLFVFYILPSFDPLSGLFLAISIASCPGSLIILKLYKIKSTLSVVNSNILFVCLLLHSACFCLFYGRVVVVRQSLLLKIILPISLVFILFSWWNNIRQNITHHRKAYGNLISAVGHKRPKLYFVLSIWKIFLSFTFVFGTVSGGNLKCLRTLMTLNEKANGCMLDVVSTITINGNDKWSLVCLCLIASAIYTIAVRFAYKIEAQVLCATVPFFLSLFVSVVLIFLALLIAKDINTWAGIPLVPDYILANVQQITLLKSYDNIYWFGLVFGGLFCAIVAQGIHVWFLKNENLCRAKILYQPPSYCSILLIPSLVINMNQDEETKEKEKPKKDLSLPMIHLCATLWHENFIEMQQLIRSIFRLDGEGRSAKTGYINMYPFDFDTHIFFDDAFKGNNELKGNVRRFCEVIRFTAITDFKKQLDDPRKYQTPYGGRLDWELPNGHALHVHLKDNRKIRDNKRSSQVMYMHYLIKYKILDETKGEEGQQKAANTFILALDGDVSFQPQAVKTLLEQIKVNQEIGSLCGRIHPVGSAIWSAASPMIWYQKFEYAVSHWFEQAAGNMLDSVLCKPGCFNMFRASALMDVMDKYATPVTSAFQKIQCDLGEDRWLCTLLLKKGYRVAYTADADFYTFAPEGFLEFFKQRRRWTPSIMANAFDRLRSWREMKDNNPNISLLFIIYHLGLLVAAVVTPGIIFMLMVGAFASAFPVLPLSVSLILNCLPIVFYIILNLKSSQIIQASCALVLSFCYCLLMGVVLYWIVQKTENYFSTRFLTVVFVALAIAATLYSQKGSMIFCGTLYFAMIPCTYLLMFIYSVANINDTSWGTRDTYIDDIGLDLSLRLDATSRVTGKKPFEGLGMKLSQDENKFWEQLRHDHLMPERTRVKEKIKKDLTTFRNTAILGFIFINSIFILISCKYLAKQTSNIDILYLDTGTDTYDLKEVVLCGILACALLCRLFYGIRTCNLLVLPLTLKGK